MTIEWLTVRRGGGCDIGNIMANNGKNDEPEHSQ